VTLLVVAAAAGAGGGVPGLRYLEPATDTRPLYPAADPLIAPSRAEALACGTLVIASDIPGRVLARLGPAVLLSVASPESLATDVQRLPRAGDAALARAGASPIPNFSVDRYARVAAAP
jgi:hypothetical protein